MRAYGRNLTAALAVMAVVGSAAGAADAEAHQTMNGHGKYRNEVVKRWKADKNTVCVRFSKRAHRRTYCHTIPKRKLDPHYQARMRAIAFARTKVGQWYLWGGTGPNVGFDCSGLIFRAYANQGRFIPRTTYAQLAGMRTPARRKAGDLVFSSNHHVALYIGHGRVIEAPHTGARLRYSSSARFSYATRSPY